MMQYLVPYLTLGVAVDLLLVAASDEDAPSRTSPISHFVTIALWPVPVALFVVLFVKDWLKSDQHEAGERSEK